MYLLKACPHCHTGDLEVLREDGELQARCLRCGHTGPLRSHYPLPERPPAFLSREQERADETNSQAGTRGRGLGA